MGPEKLPGNLPGVLIEGESSKSIFSINIDQVLGAKMAVDYLIDLGHKKIAHISGPLGWYESEKRILGWKQSLQEAKLKANIMEQGDWTPRSGYIATKRIIDLHPEVTAIFCSNDAMALGALKALFENKILVPSKMSVVGFDDIPEASYFQPALTTVVQDFELVGNASLEMLVNLIDGKEMKIKGEAIKPALIVRDSYGRVSRK